MERKDSDLEDNSEKVDDDDGVYEDSFLEVSSEEDEEVALDGSVSELEAPLTEEEIEELVNELLEKETEAQEALEEESLQKVEQEVREELAANLQGNDLDKAVADEMAAFREEWEATLDELETESAHLLEQLDGANVDLPSIYKWIESNAPNGCLTEAWKKRIHWVGTEVASDAVESIKNAEKDLQILRPVRRRHGKTLEEGASGYLAKKMCDNDSGEGSTGNPGVEWSSLNKLFSDHSSKEDIAFGSKQWASVYLASTPQQAAAMGLKFPGVEEVEEIDDIDDDPSDPFVADAIANEKELDLSEEQRKKYKKVKEEDDLSFDQKLQLHLNRRRRRKRIEQNSRHAEGVLSDNEVATCHDSKVAELGNCGLSADDLEENNSPSGDSSECQPNEPSCGSKRACEDEELDHEAKRSRTGILESDSETQTPNRNFIDSREANDMVVEEDLFAQEIDNEAMKVDTSLENVYEKFFCTACGKVTKEICEHPLLKVIVCGQCKCVIEAKIRDPQCSNKYCGWCGSSNDLLSCTSCELLFCVLCIKRNIGVEYLPEATWRCCSCSPDLLQQLTLKLEKAVGSPDSTVFSSDSDTDSSDDEDGASTSTNRTGKKKIRRILDDTELGEETKRKIAMEKERQERLKSLKAQFSSIPMMMNASTCNGSLPEGASSEVLGDPSTGFIVNVVREEGEDAVRIPPSISAKLKTHQVAGIRFMWENIIQSIRNVKAGDKGLGCILAHTMGLGKTFQVIAFLYTAMRGANLGLKTALVVTPVNVLHNWRQEFKKWEPREFKPLRVYMLEDKSREQQRAELLMKWRRKGGVFLMGYSSFRNLSLGKNMKDRKSAKEICYALQEGPDILVCDEAHIIKNTKAEITQALKLVKCQRRIALTGSPLQNNLMEYYCMVDFVREGFLGSMHEFRNRFQNPIEYGQHANSTANDVRIMNQRSHILYEQLKGFVQRMDMSVVKKDLPPKTVFVVAVKSSSLQRKLYKKFLDVHGFTGHKASCEGIRKNFFAAYQALSQICNHPWILQMMKDRGYAKREDSPDDSSSDENMDSNLGIGEKAKAKTDKGFLHEGWWDNLLNQYNHQEIEYSGKMVLLLDILTMCTEIGDKALVFSQSIATLDLIESYLSKLPRLGKKGKYWKRGQDWYRIDGKTEGSERQRLVDAFNNPQNGRVKCTLISTRAGALGINLYAANRVVIIDGSWNPTHDLQAIYRAWRYGQKKPVYAYRLVAHGTLEEKIYKRQVKKEGLAARVVDRQQVLRSMSKEEISDLFNFGDDENLDLLPDLIEKNGHMTDTFNCKKVENSSKLSSCDCPRSCSSDKLMEKLLDRHRLRWIMNFHEHETLLQENEEEKLTKEEQDLAWEVFRRSMEWPEVQRAPADIEWQEVRRVPVDESTFEQKQSTLNTTSILQERSDVSNPLANIPTRYSMQARRCTNISHLYTLRFQGTKVGCTTVCGGCGEEISWEALNRDSK
ncbi:protein CHROMATIN REMODELING 20 isoform X3 [Beta vulgaris subsp. vulgaris]|uniref:protein CHROMATIN REMODELING 20 isoform X3 n=1 Tax=Beta vulgaris subsp. vulgaris TaxID=3555 RepID=UPI0025484643|nr:protein CHROMATIN REMODELING 20 isoform X3 [Beta vulgaris subsp. vulgaris]